MDDSKINWAIVIIPIGLMLVFLAGLLFARVVVSSSSETLGNQNLQCYYQQMASLGGNIPTLWYLLILLTGIGALGATIYITKRATSVGFLLLLAFLGASFLVTAQPTGSVEAATNICILRDGSTSPTANINWGGYRITNLGNATADTDALNRTTADNRYSRISVLTVCASNAKTTTRCDYLASGSADHNTINTAIGDLATVGGTVLLSEGTFNITAAITLNGATDVVLGGSGWATNIVAPGSGTLSRMIQVGTAASTSTRITLRNFRVTGDTDLSGTADGIDVGSGGNNASSVVLDSLYVSGVRNSGIAVYAAGTIIRNTQSKNNGVNLYLSDCDDCLIEGGYYKDTWAAQTGEVIYANGGNRCKMVGVHAEQSLSNGEVVDWRCAYGTITGNTILLSGNSTSNGLLLNASATGTHVIGNTIESTSSNNNSGFGIDVAASDVTIQGNTCRWKTAQACIYVGSPSRRVTITGNTDTRSQFFTRLYDVQGPVSIIGNTHDTRSPGSGDISVRIDTVSTGTAGLVIVGNIFTNVGSGVQFGEGGGNAIDYIILVDNDFTNTSPAIAGTQTGTHFVRYNNKGSTSNNFRFEDAATITTGTGTLTLSPANGIVIGATVNANSQDLTEATGWLEGLLKTPNWRTFALNAGWTTAVTGSGAVAQGPDALYLNTGATGTSTAYAQTGTALGLSQGTVADAINFSQGSVIVAEISVVGTTNGISRLTLGKQNTDGIGALTTRRAIGIQVTNLALFGIAHNGSTGTSTNLGTSMTSGAVYHVVVESDGAGNCEWFVNGTSAGTNTGCPTGNSSSNAVLQAEVDNGGDAASQRIYVHSLKIQAKP